MTKLAVVKVLNSRLCMTCPQAYLADVILQDGQSKRMLYCGRLDCDNFILSQGLKNLQKSALPPENPAV